MTMTRVHVLAIVAGILLPISGPRFATHQSRHPSSTHSRSAVKEDRGVITSPSSRVPAFDPKGTSAYPFGPGVNFPYPDRLVWRPRSLVTLCDRETSGNGLQPASDASHLNVRFGSLADIASSSRDVRFTPNSGHSPDGLSRPLCARSGHQLATIALCFVAHAEILLTGAHVRFG